MSVHCKPCVRVLKYARSTMFFCFHLENSHTVSSSTASSNSKGDDASMKRVIIVTEMVVAMLSHNGITLLHTACRECYPFLKPYCTIVYFSWYTSLKHCSGNREAAYSFPSSEKTRVCHLPKDQQSSDKVWR